MEQDVREIRIAAVHSDSQQGQAEIYLKDISWQRQIGLSYLFKTLLSGMALGDTQSHFPVGPESMGGKLMNIHVSQKFMLYPLEGKCVSAEISEVICVLFWKS